MDAMAYVFSLARANSSNVLEFNPDYIMQEDLTSLSSKFPLIPGSQRSITLCTTCLSEKLREMPTDADFDLTDPYSPPPCYNVLHDPHLKEYFQNQAMRKRLVEKGFITDRGYVKCTLLEFNMFRQWIRKLKLDRLHQERRRERRMEIQLWNDKKAREQLHRDEELYSIVREREQKARDLKERGAKRREADRQRYFKLQEVDRKRREKYQEDKRRHKDLNVTVREKNLVTKQKEKVKEQEKEKKIKIRFLLKRNFADKQREQMLKERRQTLIEERERKLKENWKRRCSLSLVRMEEKRNKEKEERQEHEQNVERRTSIIAQQRCKSQEHRDMCLRKQRSTLEKQHRQAENFLEKIRDKKLRDLERWKQKHERLRARSMRQGRRSSQQRSESDADRTDRRRSRLSSVWDLETSLRRDFGIEDNVVYSSVVLAGNKGRDDAMQTVKLESIVEEEMEELDRFDKLLSGLQAEFALRERVHYIVFGIISNAQDVLDRKEMQETYRKIPDYVQGIVNAAQAILGNEQASDGDVRAKVRKYILEVIDGASLAFDDLGLLLSSDAEKRRKSQEIVTNAMNSAIEEVTIRNTAKEIVAAATYSAVQKAALEASKDLSECAENLLTVAIIAATRYIKDDQDMIVAKSLAFDAVNAAKASLERLYGVKLTLVAGERMESSKIRSASLDKCAKEVAATAIISATRSLEKITGRRGSDLIAARTLAANAVAAAKASLERLYGVNVETADEDQDHSEVVCKYLVKSVKELAKAAISPSVRSPQESAKKDDFESLTAQSLANDAIRSAKESLENFYGTKVKKDLDKEPAREIAAAAVMSAACSLEKGSLGRDRNVTIAAQGLASSALDSAKASVGWIYRTKVSPKIKIKGKTDQTYRRLDEVAKDIAEVAVSSATQSLEHIAYKQEWNLTAATWKLANDVLNSAKGSLERLYGIKIDPEEGPTLPSPETSESSLVEYPLSSSNDLLESVKGHEHDLWIAAQSLAEDALKSATTSLERLYSMANQMEDNIKQTALDISKTLMDSSGNLRQKLEKEGLVVAARDLAYNAIASAAKAFPKLHEDEMTLQDIAGTDASLLNAAAKVSTVSVRASLGELFDRGFIGDLELDEATSYLATHAMVSAENLIDTLQGDTGTLDLDLEIYKAATELPLSVGVSTEGVMAGSVDEDHQTSSGLDLIPSTLYWRVTTYVEGLINGALRYLGAEGYYVEIIDNPDQYEVLTHDQARSADMQYGTHDKDIFHRELLALRASRIVTDVVETAMDIVKTQMASEPCFIGQSVADSSSRNVLFTRQRSSSVHFNDETTRRDSYVPRETDFLSTANRPPTPRFRKGHADSTVTQQIHELENELEIPSDTDLTVANTSESGLVRASSLDPGPECHSEDVSSCQPERSTSDCNIGIMEQGTSINKKLSVYDIIKRREEVASCEISPRDSYVVLPQLNPSERFLIAARVESYEALWKRKKATPSVTSLPSLSPRGSFVASESVEVGHPRKKSKNLSVQSSSRLPKIGSPTSKIYGSSVSASSLKDTSMHPKQTSSRQLKKSPKASPKTSRESAILSAKPSTEKTLHSPRASVGKVKVTSTTSLGKKESRSRRSSLENMGAVASKASLNRVSDTKVIHSSGGSLTKANLSPRASRERATPSNATSSSNQIKSSHQSSKLVARGSTQKMVSSSSASLGKGEASPGGSMEKAALSPRESKEDAVLSPRISNSVMTSSPRTSSERVVISSRTSKEVLLSPRISAVNATLPPCDSKRNITQSPPASTKNAVLSPRVSKGKINQLHGSLETITLSTSISKGKVMQSPSAITNNTTLSPSDSKGKITQTPRSSTENAVMFPCVSKGKINQSHGSLEKITLSPSISNAKVMQSLSASTKNTTLSPSDSKGKITQTPRSSTENAVLSPRVSKGKINQSHGSLENITSSPSISKGQVMQSPSASTKNTTLSPSDSKGKITQTPRSSTENAVLSPRVSKGKINQSHGSLENITSSPSISKGKVMQSPSASTKNTTLSPSDSKGKITQTPRSSTENAVLSPRVSKGTIKQSHGSLEKITLSPSISNGKVMQSPSASTKNTTLSPSDSKGKITQTPRSSTENAVLSPRVSKGTIKQSHGSLEKITLSPSISNGKVMQSPSATTKNTTLSPSDSKGKITQTPRSSTENAVLSPRVSKGKINQSPRGSAVNAASSLSISKRNGTNSPSATTGNTTLSPSGSKGNITQSSRALTENAALSSRVSKEISSQSSFTSNENAALSQRVSKDKVMQSPPASTEHVVQSKANALNDDGVSSPSALDEETAIIQHTLLHKVIQSVTKPDDVVSTFPKTHSTGIGTPLNQSANYLDSQDALETEATEKSKTILKGPSYSGGKLLQDSPSSQKLERAVEIVGDTRSVEITPLMQDVSQQQETDSGRLSPGLNNDETDEESMEVKHIEVNNSLKVNDHSLERIIQEKRLTPEGAEADTRPASSADIAASRKCIDSTGPQTSFLAQLDANKGVKSSLAELPESSREKVALKASGVEKEIFPSRKKPEGENQSELEGGTSDEGIVCGKNEGENRGASMDGKRFQVPGTIKKKANDLEGYPTYRKVSVSRSIRDTVDDIVQRMLDSADEPNLEPENSHSSDSDPLEGMKQESEISFEAHMKYGRERKVSRTVMETVDFLVQTVSSSDERRPRDSSGRQFNTGIPRTASFIERSPRGSNTSTQDIACVYEISPSPPVGPPPKLPSPKRSLLRATSSQDSVGLRATQSDSSILSSSSDKSADLRHKVSAAWLDGVTAEGGDASVTSQSPKRPSSSPTSSQLRRSSVRLSAKNSLDGVCLGTGGSAEKK